MSIKGEAFGQQLVVLVKDYFARATQPLLQRLDGVEKNFAHLLEQFKTLTEKIPTPEDIDKAIADAVTKHKPADGKDADPEMIRSMVGDAVAKLPPAQNGKDADPAVIQAMVKEAVAKEELKPAIDISISAAFEKLKAAWIKDLQDLYASIPKPQDGKDADPEVIRAMVAEAVAKIPKPENGKDADEGLIRELVQRSVEAAIVVQRSVEAAIVVQRSVEAAVATLPVPRDGRDADPEDIRKAVEAAVAAIPVPKDGAPADPEETLRVVRETVGEGLKNILQQSKEFAEGIVDDRIIKAVEALPKPQDGKDADMDALRELIYAEVKKLPPAEPGKPGKDADLEQVVARIMPDAIKAVAALRVPTVEDFRQLFETEQAKWALDFERRAQDLFQKAIDRMPQAKDGKDGLGFEDMDIVTDAETGQTSLVFWVKKGDTAEIKREFSLPTFHDRGVWSSDAKYYQGNGVTWGGSFFLAQKDAPVGKPGESTDWRCAVKRGQDGKDLRPNDPKSTPVVRTK